MLLTQLASYCNSTSVAVETGKLTYTWPEYQGPAHMPDYHSHHGKKVHPAALKLNKMTQQLFADLQRHLCKAKAHRW